MRPKDRTPKVRDKRDPSRAPAARRATLNRRAERAGKRAIREGRGAGK